PSPTTHTRPAPSGQMSRRVFPCGSGWSQHQPSTLWTQPAGSTGPPVVVSPVVVSPTVVSPVVVLVVVVGSGRSPVVADDEADALMPPVGAVVPAVADELVGAVDPDVPPPVELPAPVCPSVPPVESPHAASKAKETSETVDARA